LKSSAPLQTRVGVATGLVIVGDLIGSGQAQERGIVGETPNLAARLQGIAKPNTVVIAEATRRLLGNLFELQDLGSTELKGIAGPRRQKMLEALGVQLESLACSSPVLMILEDAHWTEPTSLEVFGRTVDQVARLRVLLIVTFRPEFEAPWIGQPHVTAVGLNRLGHREVNTLIERVVGNKPLAANIRKDIIERTDGVPLFVEEMTPALLPRQGLAGGEYSARNRGFPARDSEDAIPGDRGARPRSADLDARPAAAKIAERKGRKWPRPRMMRFSSLCSLIFLPPLKSKTSATSVFPIIRRFAPT
jgi:hypothetical protein